jgi:hypothetical protein
MESRLYANAGCGFSAVSAWVPVRVVRVVCLIAFWFPGRGW